jgi:peptidoglycan hydrolase-like protein with peptidoglycan-binding domain
LSWVQLGGLAGLPWEMLVVDGDFGLKTEHGVMIFQKLNEIESDGIVGLQTWSGGDGGALRNLAETVGV